MLRAIPVKRPFPTGTCQICHKLAREKNLKLCRPCERYVNQDHIGRTADPLFGSILEDLDAALADHPTEARSLRTLGGADYEGPDFEQLLSRKNLTARQRRVLRLIFVEGKSWGWISKRLGISPSSVRDHVQGAIKKLKKYHSIPVLVKGQSTLPGPLCFWLTIF